MRRNNWKVKVVVIIALILGIAAGIIVVVEFPEEYVAFRGLCAFATMAIVEVGLTFIGMKLFGSKGE